MKRFFSGLVCFVIISGTSIFSQNVAINTTGAVANPAAMLDISSTNTGVLIPRVALSATNSNAPVGAGVVTSLMVYNTATASAGATAVAPGYYYWDGAQWVRLFNTGNAWQTGGNFGTNPATNYAGTADAQDFAIRTNAIEKMRVTAGGNLGVGTIAPGARVDIVGGGSATVDLRVNGRIQTGDAAGNGGIWLSNANDGFVGNTGGNIGFWNPATGWNAFQIVKSTGNVTINSTTYNQSVLRVECAAATASTDAFAFFNSGGAGANQWTFNAYQATADGGCVYGECSNGTNNNMAVNGVNLGSAGLATRGFHAGAGAGTGVLGVSNVSVAYGVRGSIPTTGAWTGFGGLFQGGLGYVNGLYNLSDQRFKKNIQPIIDPIKILQSIEGKTYEMESPYSGITFRPGRNYGFIAQDLQKVLPEVVADKKLPIESNMNGKSMGTTEYVDVKMIDYVSLIPILVEAIKTQQTTIEKLEKRIGELEKK